jgi:hypothetical protein
MATANPLQPEAFDPVLDAMARAPVVRRLTTEQRAELDQAVADLAAGRSKAVPHDDAPAWLEEMASHERAG